jgi:CheY-like chemotaxis protein
MLIAVSGYGQDEDRRRSKNAGFDYHVIKPLDHDVLFSLPATKGDELVHAASPGCRQCGSAGSTHRSRRRTAN